MQAWKGELELKELRVNVKETKMTIINQNAGKISKEDKSPRTVCSSNSILCQFCRCWVHKRCSSIRGELKDDSKFKCQTCVNYSRGFPKNRIK